MLYNCIPLTASVFSLSQKTRQTSVVYNTTDILLYDNKWNRDILYD